LEFKEESHVSRWAFRGGLAAKRVAPKAPLAVLLFATEVLDVLFFVFLFAGIERNSEKIELSYIPWSHGLVMAIVWSILAGIITFLISKDRRTSIVIALVVFGHWVLDFIGHDPDLPLMFDNSQLVGLAWSGPTRPLDSTCIMCKDSSPSLVCLLSGSSSIGGAESNLSSKSARANKLPPALVIFDFARSRVCARVGRCVSTLLNTDIEREPL
jgi:hypothetical protein